MIKAIKPPSMLGMLGGGQLGKFFVEAAHRLGYEVMVLDPDQESPAIKKIKSAIEGGDSKVAKKAFEENVSVIDRIADKKIIHKNKAARRKSRLNTAIKSM